jgi:hypothetical protein
MTIAHHEDSHRRTRVARRLGQAVVKESAPTPNIRRKVYAALTVAEFGFSNAFSPRALRHGTAELRQGRLPIV